MSLTFRPLMPPARLIASKYARDAYPTTPATETGPLNGTVCPNLISVAETPRPYCCAVAVPAITNIDAMIARNMLPSIGLSSLGAGARSPMRQPDAHRLIGPPLLLPIPPH